MRTFTQKMACLLMVLLCCANVQLKADELTVNDGTTTNLYVPLYGFYADTNGKSQFVVSSDDLSGVGSISGLTFYASSDFSFTGTWEVRLMETTEESVSSSFLDVTNATLVYTGLIVISNGEASIEFDDVFTFENGENLLVEVSLKTTGNCSSTSAPLWYGVDTGTSRGGSGSNPASRNFLPKVTFDYTPGSGSGSTCTKPTSLVVTEAGAKSVSLAWEGGSGTYDVGYKLQGSTDDYDYTERNTTATNFTFPGLQPNTSYSFAVKSKCGGEESQPRSVNAKTAIAIPYEENFDALSAIPSDWKQYTGLLADVLSGSASLVSTTYGWSFLSGTTGVFESKHVYSNIYGTSRKNWLVLPSINMEGNAVLTFNVALSGSSSSSTDPATTGTDDKFAVLVSTDNGATWTVLRQWDNSGSESSSVYNDIPKDGVEVTIDLSVYGAANANVMLAFYGESTVSNADNYLHIDDVVIDFGRSCLKPTGLKEVAGKATKSSVQIAWDEDANADAWKVQYKKTTETDWITVDANENPFDIEGLEAYTDYNVRVAALCDATDETSLTRYCKEITVKTAAGVPYHEGFNHYSVPSDWKRYDISLDAVVNGGEELVAATSGWSEGSKNSIFPDSTYHLYLNTAGAECHKWIVSPAIEMEDGYELSFDLALTKSAGGAVTAGEQADDMFAVLVFDGEDWNIAAQWDNKGGGYVYDEINATASGQIIKIDLSAYKNKNVQIAFYGESTDADSDNNLHISNVSIDLIPDCAPALSLDINNVGATSATAVWTADAAGTWQYGFVANPAAEFAPAETDYLEQTTTALAVDLQSLVPTTKYAFFVRRDCGGAHSDSIVRYFTTTQQPENLPYSNDFEETNGWLFFNGECANHWVWGEATGVNSSSKSLYISADEGATNTYAHSHTLVYATKLFYFDEQGTYSVSYDWKGQGESGYDFMRVALAPAETEVTASTATSLPSDFGSSKLPNGWVALDGGSQLCLQSDWQHVSEEVAITEIGYKKVIIAWHNDGSVGTQDPAAAIDNFRIGRLACPTPTGLEILDISATGALAVWNDESDGNTWVYACIPATEAEPAAEAMTEVSQNSLQVPNLTPMTNYVFYLCKKCGEDFSASVSAAFKTDANPFAMPFVENFNDLESGIPEGWNNEEGTMTTASYRWNYYATGYEGAGLRMNSYNPSSGVYSILATPKIILSEPALLSFQWKNPAGGAAEIFIAGKDGQRISLKNSGMTGVTEWQLVEINLSDYTNDTVTIFFKGISNCGYNDAYLYLDDVKVEALPSCMKPTDLAVVDGSITTSSVQLGWTAGLNETAWSVQYKKQADEEWETIADATNPFTLDGLDPATVYDVKVAAQCEEEEISDYSDAISFVTECEAIAISDLPFKEGFDSITGSTSSHVMPLCWNYVNTCSYVTSYSDYSIYPTVYSSASYANTPDNSLRFYSTYSTYTDYDPQDQYAILPEMESEISALRIKLNARKYSSSYNADFTVGVMSDPSDTATFVAVATLSPASEAYEAFVVPFDTYAGEGKFIAIKFAAATSAQTSRYVHIDDIVVEEIPSCLEVSALAVLDTTITINSAEVRWTAGGAETAWLVQYKKAADEEWLDIDAQNDTVPLSSLVAATKYEVRVAAKCSDTEVSPFSDVISFYTACDVYTMPFVENFNDLTAGIPICWDKEEGTVTTASYKWNSYETGHEGRGLRFNSYIASKDLTNYLKTPVITVNEAAVLSFWFKNPTGGDFSIFYSVDGAVYDTLAVDLTGVTAWTPKEIFLPDSCVGRNIEVIFKGTSNCGSGDAYIYLDDVKIDAVPACLKPENLAVSNIANHSVQLSWTAQNEETAWSVQYKKQGDEEWTTVPADANPFVLEGLAAATAYEVQVAAQCGEAVSEFTPAISFVTECDVMTEFPYEQNFDGITGSTNTHVLPICWDYINACTYSSYKIYPTVYNSSTYNNSTPNALRFYSYNDEDYDPQDQYAILPEMEGVSGLRMKFNARAYSTSSSYFSYDAAFTVGVMSDPADASTFVAVKAFNPATTTYEPFVVAFNTYAGEGKYIAIKMAAADGYVDARGFFIDDLRVEELPNCLEPDSLQAVLTQGQGSIATLQWAAGAVSAWEVQYGMDATFADAITANVSEPTLSLTGLISDSTYYARVKAICSATEESDWSNVISFTPMNAIIINDGTTTGSYVPFYGYYADMGTNSQFIIPEKEIAAIQWDSITKLTFFASTTTATWEGAQFDVYVAETNDTVLSAMVAWTDMQKVVNSKHLELANKQMVVTFDAPYQYQGGNLLIGFKQTVTGTDVSCSWYGKSGVSGNSMYQYSTYTASKSEFNPKVKIDHIYGERPTCFVVKNITVSDITPSSAVLNWTPGEEGQNAWQIVYSADPAFDLASIAAEDIHDVTALPYAIAELETDTLYKVYVRANCSEEDNEDYSLWSELFTFHTASSCQKPDGLEAKDITVNAAAIHWTTYGQTGFNLRYGTDGTNWTVVENAAMPYTISGLDASTSYKVQVQAVCAAEEENSWSATYTFKTAYGIPFEEKFNATSIPTDWKKYTGLLGDVLAGSANLATTTSGWNFTSGNGIFDTHARINIYSTTTNYWLATPTVHVNGDVQLTFDIALSYWNGTLVPVTAGQQADDKFVVLISTDEGATWSVLRQWDNAGSEYVYDNIACSATGEQVVINLADYSGQGIQIAFYGESTVSGGDNYFHLDNVSIDIVPTCLKPSNLAADDIKAHSAQLSWTNGEEGQTAWQIVYDTLPTTKPDTLPIIDVTVNPYVLSGLDPETRYYVYVRANCGAEDGVSRWADGIYFTTTIACPAPTGLAAQLTAGNGSIATLTWTAGEAQAWQVEYSINADMTDSIVLNVTETTVNLTELIAEQKYYARVKADCGELDGESAYSAVISFTPSDKYELLLNDGATTTNRTYVPIEGSYVDEGTRSQFIIPETDLVEIEWDSIMALTFYGEFASTSRTTWGDAEWEVYVTEAPETTMSALVDWNAMTQVKAAAKLALVDGEMVVTFDAPYQYQGGNLMIGIYQTTNGAWANVNWFGVNATGASFGGHGNGSAVSQRNFLPKMAITYVPGQAPACPNPKQLAVSNITDSEATFSWKAFAGANWEYALVEGAAAPESFEQTDLNSITIDELAEATQYTFYLRRACGEDGNSEMIHVAFSTDIHVAAIPFNDDFEGANYWKFVALENTNAWIVGNAVSNGGEKAMYVSNNGNDYAYNPDETSASFATVLLHFEETGDYTIDYDWKGEGDYDDDDVYDFMRVGLIPAAATVTAGIPTLPEDFIALDNGALYGQADWQHVRLVFQVEAAGDYKLLVAWINDEADGETPGAIDNIAIISGNAITGIEGNAGFENKAVKFIQNQNIYILINGVIYDVTGRKVGVK